MAKLSTLLLTFCLLSPLVVTQQRAPFMERLASFATRPFWSVGRTQRLGASRSAGKAPSIDPDVLKASIKFAEGVISRQTRLERTLAGADVRVRPGSPSHGQLLSSLPADEALIKHREAQIALKASQFLADNNCRKFNLKERRCGELVNSQSLSSTSLASSCPSRSLTCPESRYRTLDGTCNNKAHPSWGSAFTAYRRELKPQYADGLQAPRWTSGLTSSREVSAVLITDSSKQEKDVTLAVMQWTQFITEDLVQTPAAKMTSTGSSITCCKPDGGSLPPRSMHPSCSPIKVSSHDPIFKGHRCLDYVRSLLAPRSDCRFGSAEQMNQATHWLDGSMVYGTSEAMSQGLREKNEGRMMVSTGDLLPLHENPTSGCQSITKPLGPCFKSGDSRVNEHPMLTALHTIMLREHNHIAKSLHILNPHWNDERLYQEARRIVIAEIQYITYSEWLPALLGETYARQSSDYASNANPAIRNSVATAALQFTFSMMSSALELHDERRSSNSTLRLRDHFNRPAILHEFGMLDQLIRALATQNAQSIDLIHTEDVTSGMYASEDGGLGLDALSVLIQRGRDHGLPGYNSYRAECGHSTAQSIDDFADLIPRNIVDQFKTVYSKANDVDLFVGAMAERPAEDSLVGPTFRCLLSRQFRDTRRADRYFYDVTDQPGSFTPEQVSEIKKTSLARVFCDNSDDIQMMQPDVFHKPASRRKGIQNELILCSQLNSPDLTPWKEVPRAI